MSSPRSRSVTPAQLVALLLAFLSLAGLTGVLGAGLVVPLAGSLGVIVKTGPTVLEGLPANFQLVDPAEESMMLDAQNNVLARFYDKRRIVVTSEQISPNMKQAIVAIEDRRFYEHHGIDPDGLARALVNNLSDSSGTQGASTITQQFVRNMLQEKGYLEGDPDLVSEASEVTAERKLREMKLALTLETSMTKDQILSGYLNIAPFGPITYGVEAAAQLYFSTAASELTINQSALLAGLVQSPVEYNPLVNPELAEERRNDVLWTMHDQSIITKEEFDADIAVPVVDMLHPNIQPEGCAGAPRGMQYFCDYAIKQFMADPAFGESAADRDHLLKTGGITIRTTIDQYKQEAAMSALTTALPMDNPYGETGLNDAIASVDPGTGRIVAMAQNTPYGVVSEEAPRDTMFNFAADGAFQVGSTFKVFTLIQWFKEGHGAYDTVGSTNRNYPNGSFKCGGSPITTDDFRVEDLAGKDGPTTVLRATEMSINQAFISMASKVDFCQIFQNAADLGVTAADGSTIAAYPANVIGSGASSPLTMASAFATIINTGVRCEPQALADITDRNENLIKSNVPNCVRAMDETVANKTATLLAKSSAEWYGPREGIYLDGGRPYGAKTGTTDDNSNTWTVGFTPQLATAAWMGYGHASSAQVHDIEVGGTYYSVPYGSTVASNIWAPYMSAALLPEPWAPMPNVFIGDLPRPSPSPSSSASPSTTPAPGGDSSGDNNGNGNGNSGGSSGNSSNPGNGGD